MDIDPYRIARTGAEVLLGLLGTAGLVVVLLRAVQPLRTPVYHAFYRRVGPWTAETTAGVLVFVLVAVVAIGLPTLLSVAARGDREALRPLAAGLAVALAVVVTWVSVAALVGVPGLLAAAAVVGAVVVGGPLALRHVGVWPRGVATFAGGVPVLLLLLLLLGFGLGWGGGYVVVATEVPADAVDGSADASFADAPELREDLLRPSGDVPANCEENGEGGQVCRLYLRGYEHEASAARFLDDHGVRCPARGAPAGEGAANQSFVAEDDGTYYRVTCTGFGD